MRFRLLVFLVLTGILVAASIGWELVRHGGRSEERATWEALTDTLRTQQGRIDSLEVVLARLDERLTHEKRALATMQERIGHYERRASGGRLPTPQYREYMRTIESHNQAVTRHNATLAEMQRIYAAYSVIIDRHNAHVDSANVMQRRATQEGYTLPERSR
jgi:hypothetical protein